jgi:hypothetical protein
VLPRAPSQSSVTGRKKNKMIQIGARQTEGPLLPSESDPSLRTEILTTLAAGRFAVRDEYLKFSIPFTLRFHNLFPNSFDPYVVVPNYSAFPYSLRHSTIKEF